MAAPTPHARSLLVGPLGTASPATHARRASTPATVTDAGEVYGRLVPWDTPATVSDDGETRYTESFARGGLVAPGDGVIPVYAGHTYGPDGTILHGPLVGRLDDVTTEDDGLYGRVVLADVPAAAQLRALAHTVGATFSVEFTDTAAPTHGRVLRTAATLTGVAVLTLPERGAFTGAEVLAVRTAPPDPDPDDPDDPDGPDDPADGLEGDGQGVEGAEVVARTAIAREVRRVLGTGVARTQPHPLARFGSAFEFQAAARLSASDELPRLFADAYRAHHARAWVDQVTGDNPGVIPPAWLSEVFGIIDMGRPVISAIGTRALPPAGMDISWPYFDGDLHALVGPQVAQKTEIVSVKVSLKKASTGITTYAGGSDLSWQLIRRSDPSYRDAYLRIMQAAYGTVTDAAATDAVEGAGTGDITVDISTGDADGTLLRGAIFEASSMVQLATGQPASFILAAPDLFNAFASQPTMVPSSYGTQNVSGTAQASTLDVNISGLRVAMAPELAAGTAIVSNSLACAWFEDGPFVVAAPDIPKLGEDVAIWGMGAFGAFLAAGIVTITATLPAAPLAASSSRTTKK